MALSSTFLTEDERKYTVEVISRVLAPAVISIIRANGDRQFIVITPLRFDWIFEHQSVGTMAPERRGT